MRVPLDALVECVAYLTAQEQCVWCNVNSYFQELLNHAFQRDYVGAAIHEGYVERMETFYCDDDPLRVIPVCRAQLLHKLITDPRWKSATLVVNVAMSLPSFTVLPDAFLRHASFRAIHFVGMDNVESVSNRFCAHCPNLEWFTMATPCPKLTTVGDYWLHSCSSLRGVVFSGLVALGEVSDEWLSECTSLESLSFAELTSLKEVGYGWLSKCNSLTTVSFAGLSALGRIDGCWLYGCQSLRSVDFSGLTALRAVAYHWLSECSSLESVSFEGLSSLRVVGASWLAKCVALETVSFAGLSALETVDDSWLSSCTSLQHIEFSGLGALRDVGNDWLRDCRALRQVDLKACTGLREIGPIACMKECPMLERVLYDPATLSPNIAKHIAKVVQRAPHEKGGRNGSYCSFESL